MSATILIVEDSPTVRRMVRLTLEDEGFRVEESEDGREALALLHERAALPDLVLTDVNMPEMDGLSLVRAIREAPALRFLPVLVLTTESGDDMKRRGREAGATGWIVKPFDPARLLRTIRQVLALRAAS